MFDRLKSLFSGPSAPTHPELDPHVAAAALFVEAALSDGVYADCEEAAIRQTLTRAFGLSDDKAERVLKDAEDLAESAVDHHRFTKVVKTCLSHQERVSIVENLWRIALADGEKSPFEDAFIRRVAPLLAVSDRDRAFARKRAEASARNA